jgi:hypothetical protein
MANYIEKICKLSGVVWKQYNSLQKCTCDECKKLIPKKVYAPKKFNSNLKLKSLNPIPKVSKKRKIENAKYSVLRIEFLNKPENRICFIDGCNKPSTTIEHRVGRWGKNYLDTTTWAGCCLEHNLELENNSELSKKYQLSKIHGGKKI